MGLRLRSDADLRGFGPEASTVARALLRLQSLLLTVALVATTCYIALDLVASGERQEGRLDDVARPRDRQRAAWMERAAGR